MSKPCAAPRTGKGVPGDTFVGRENVRDVKFIGEEQLHRPRAELQCVQPDRGQCGSGRSWRDKLKRERDRVARAASSAILFAGNWCLLILGTRRTPPRIRNGASLAHVRAKGFDAFFRTGRLVLF